jgi:uncharacterized protein (TIGR00661 family)
MRFAYDATGRLQLGLSILRNLAFVVALPARARSLARRLRLAAVDLVITDFEPSLPRAAKIAGIPFLTVDHQSFLCHGNLGKLPWALRWRAALMAPFTRAHYPAGAQAAVISGFFQPPLLPGPVPTKTAGILLRPEVRASVPTDGSHLVAYFRRTAPEGLLEALIETGKPVRVYGLGPLPRRQNLEFHPVSNAGFLSDLASCEALVSTAGNQLVGEALWLGKPVLAIPEEGNWEQRFNAWFLDRGGEGMTNNPGETMDRTVQRFLSVLPQLRERICTSQARQDGMPVILETVLSVIEDLPNRMTRAVAPSSSTHSATVLIR